jgi:hypothetical protein
MEVEGIDPVVVSAALMSTPPLTCWHSRHFPRRLAPDQVQQSQERLNSELPGGRSSAYRRLTSWVAGDDAHGDTPPTVPGYR